MQDHEDTLCRLAIRDDAFVESVLARVRENVAASGLDPKTHALACVGALIAMDAAPPSYMSYVESGLASGATADEIVGLLIAVMPAVGVARVVSAAPKLGLALGYDVAGALEGLGGEALR